MSIINQRSILEKLTFYNRQTLIWNCNCSSTEKLILMALNHQVDLNGECSPTQRTIEKQCNVTRVDRWTDRLVKKGLIVKVRRFSEDKGQLSNQYQILFEALKNELESEIAS